MPKKSIHSAPGLFGTVTHRDEKGKKIGESRPGLFGSTIHYDVKGKKVGESRPGLFGGTIHTDAKGNRIGTSALASLAVQSIATHRGGRWGEHVGWFGGVRTWLDKKK